MSAASMAQALLGVSAVAPKVLTFRTNASDPADLTTYNGTPFQGLSIGTAASDRRVIVAVHGVDGVSASPTISSATIGGVSATIICQTTVNARAVTGIIIAAVPTGTTADVSITFSSGLVRAAIGVWTCTGLTSSTAVDSGTSGATPGTKTLTTVAGGFAVGAISEFAGNTFTWTNLTEDYDATITTDGGSYGGAHAATSTTSLAITGAYDSAANANRGMAVASW